MPQQQVIGYGHALEYADGIGMRQMLAHHLAGGLALLRSAAVSTLH